MNIVQQQHVHSLFTTPNLYLFHLVLKDFHMSQQTLNNTSFHQHVQKASKSSDSDHS